MPNISRGTSFRGVMRYLVGPGKANEHTDPHLVAGCDEIRAWTPAGMLDRAAADQIAHELGRPLRARAGEPPAAGAVWHCSLSVKAGEGRLGDDVWRRAAHDFMGRMGWLDAGTGEAVMPWVAVGHGVSKNGNDHVHLVVSMVRYDGRIADTRHDFNRAQQACRAIETELELEPLHTQQLGIGERGITPAEHSRAAATGSEPPRRRLERIVRAASVDADSETRFITRLRADGIQVAPFYANGGETVTGYKVRLGSDGRWFGGGKLARDLTLPRLRQCWQLSGADDPGALAAWRGKNSSRHDPGGRGSGPSNAGRVSDGQITAAAALIDEATAAAVADGSLARWAAVSHDVAGILAAASRAAEGDTPGPLANASRAAARLGQIHRRSLDGVPRPRTGMASAARAARALGRTRGRAGSAAFWRQLAVTMRALAQAADARKQARIAEKMLASARQDLDGRTTTPASTPAAVQNPRAAARPAGTLAAPETMRRARTRPAAARSRGRGR